MLLDLRDLSNFALGLGGAVVASIGTGAGAVPIAFFPKVSRRWQDVLLSSAAGIMLAATALSLIAPGVEMATRQTGSQLGGAAVIGAGLLAGALVILFLHRHAPHEHLFIGRQGPASTLRRTWLIVIAMTLHNFPEGFAVGVGFGGGDLGGGLTILTAIFLQNMPEGFVVGLVLLNQGYSRAFAVLIAFATGLAETIGGLVGAGAVALVVWLLPFSMGFAAGAMLFVISHEIIPETHRNNYETEATFGLVGGFVVMLLLQAIFQ